MAKKRTESSSTSASRTGSRTKSATKKTTAKKSGTKKTTKRGKTPAQLQSALKKADREIVKLINERAKLTTELIENQEDAKEFLFNPLADEEVYNAAIKMSSGPLSEPAVRAIFREILGSAKQNVKRQRVAYLGPGQSFSHVAAIEQFGKSATLIEKATIAAVFEEVNRGNADYGIVPIENSTDGRVVDTLDMFTRLPLRICGEVLLSIHHNLLSNSPSNEITEIYSKAQALSQCRGWLSKNMPQAKQIEVGSTSAAAQIARGKAGAAAVASRQAATEYDLQVVAEDIQDNPHNITRFAIIGDEETKASGKDRTAVLLQIKHKPGALSDALETFKQNKINLTWIESFPLRGDEAGYLFFLDFEGHLKEAKVKRTLTALEEHAVRMDVLGSYPRSEPVK